MKKTLFILISISIFTCYSQEPIAAIESPEMNILYRGNTNKVVPAVTNNHGGDVQLLGSSNLTISKSEDNDYYIVKPGTGRTGYLHVVLVNDQQIDTIKTVQYRIMNLPDPTLYWGGAKSSQKANIKEIVFFAKYTPEIPLNAQFSITSWTIKLGTETISGKGNNITSAQSFLEKIESNTELEVEMMVTGPDGVQRKLSGTWRVIPWSQETKEIITIKCAG